MKPVFFATAAAFRAWLKKHHKKHDELIVGFYRKLETRWVHGARQEETRVRRLDKLIAACESGRRR